MFRFAYLLYLLLFFGYYQSDVLGYLCGCVLGRPYEAWTGWLALVLTLAAAALLRLGERMAAQRGVSPFLPYVCLSWLVVVLVSFPFRSPLWIGLWAVVGALLVGLEVIVRRTRSRRLVAVPWKHLLDSTISLLFLALYLGLGAGATDVDHYELRTARALQLGRDKEAYRVGERELATSPRLFAMRCMVMTRTHRMGLGDQLFEQPVPAGGSRNLLLPDDRRQAVTLPVETLYRLLGDRPEAGEQPIAYLRRCADRALREGRVGRGEHMTAPVDYYLCGLLLDRRLDDFAREVRRFYPLRVRQAKLPAYYAQALLAYMRQRTNPAVSYHDSAVEANYHDYNEMGDTLPNRIIRSNLLRQSYGETFWWYMEYAR